MMDQEIDDLIAQMYDEYPHIRTPHNTDSGNDETRRLLWQLNLKRSVRNKRLTPCPAANVAEAGGT